MSICNTTTTTKNAHQGCIRRNILYYSHKVSNHEFTTRVRDGSQMSIEFVSSRKVRKARVEVLGRSALDGRRRHDEIELA
jgi:hypothetical protein